MENTLKWMLPTSIRSRKTFYEFDLSTYSRTFFSNEQYWKRKFSFDKTYDFDKSAADSITSVKFRIHPFCGGPIGDNHKLDVITEEELGIYPDHSHIIQRGNLRKAKGILIIEIKFDGHYKYSDNLILEQERDPDYWFSWEDDFEYMRWKMLSIANDIASFFMLGLHFTYLTHGSYHERSQPQSSGLMMIRNAESRHIMEEHSDMASYPILLEEESFNALKLNWGMLCHVWHKDIWTFHRFLKAVRSNYITIDHLVDLVFSIESMFGKNTPSQTIKETAAAILGKDPDDAKRITDLLTAAFKIRNEVAHGGKHYGLSEPIPGKFSDDMRVMDLYWELKNLLIYLMHYGTQKLLNDKSKIQPSAIRFGKADLVNRFF